MIFKIFIALTGLFGLYRLSKIKDKFAWIITILLVIGVLLIFIPSDFARTIGFAFLNFPVFLIIVYSVIKKYFSVSKRINLLVQTVPMGISQFLFLTNWNQTNFVGYFMIVPIAAFIYTLTKLNDYRNEIGFLAIISSYSISRLALTIQHGF